MYWDSRLWGFTTGFRARVFWSVLVGLAAAVLGIARLALLGWLLAKVFAGDSLENLIVPVLLVAGVILVRAVLQYAKDVVAHGTAAKVQLALRQRLHDHILHLGAAQFTNQRTGDVTLSLVDGVEQLETYFGQYLPQLFISVLTPLLLFGVLVFLDGPVALVLSAFALLTLFAPGIFHRWNRRGSLRRREAYGNFAGEFLDAIQGFATLKALGQSGPMTAKLARQAHEVFRSTMWVLATNSLTHGITVAGIALGASAALGLGALRVEAGLMSLTSLLMILMMGMEVFRPLRELSQLLHQGMVGLSAAEGVLSVLAMEPLVQEPEHPEESPLPLQPSVSFEGVRFAYPGSRKGVHEHLDFHLNAGERVGFVAPSGSGKSTIVRLLLRLYDPQAGRVLLGGRDVRKLRFSALRGQIAVVHQDTFLFHGSIEDNLRLGKPDASLAELDRAAATANILGFIQSLPSGYATLVGERGLKLSGGQRQRIAIARALLKDAPVLVLDEALSAVDSENEYVIQEALERLMVGRTTLIFAHRLSSVVGADRILVLDQGAVAESGSHGQLMAAGGVYHQLMATQDSEAAAGSDTEIPGGETAIIPLEPTPQPAQEASSTATAEEATEAILRAEGMGWLRTGWELLKMVAPWWVKLLLTFGLGVARFASLIGVGVFSALIVAAVKAGQPVDWALALLVACALATAVLHWLESWVSHDMAFRLLSEMRIALFEQLDRLAPAYLLRRRTGDLVAMATQDVETVEYFFAHVVAAAFVAVLMPLAVLGVLAWFGWPLALALLPFLVAVGISPLLGGRRLERLGSRAREALGAMNAHAVDTVQGLHEIAAFQRESWRAREFLAKSGRHAAVRLPYFKDLTLQKVILEGATGLGGLVTVLCGAWLVLIQALDPAVLPLLTLLAMAAFLPVSEIATVGKMLSDTLGSTRRLYAVHNEAVLVRDGKGVNLPRHGGLGGGIGLAMSGVGFSYPGTDRLALDSVSFTIPAGGTVALVGPSGAGKSTIAHFFTRFWDPDTGSVSLGGIDLRDFRLDHLRSMIGLVAQDTYLFNDTLLANIAMANPEATAEQIEQAIEMASLREFVAELPQGLETPVGERGTHLSGGQRQRVAIARAFLQDAPVLILDEATSHLDAVNERLVRQALERLMRHRTTLVIAHRLSTVKDADTIIVLQEGRVRETGTHLELLAKKGAYARLIQRQQAGGRRTSRAGGPENKQPVSAAGE